MSSATLLLRNILNDPSRLDMGQEWIALDNGPTPTILVYGETLANAILRSEEFATYNIYAYWKILLQAPPSEFTSLETFFDVAPLFLHGEAHRQARKALVQPYRRIESGLDAWLDAFAEDFFASLPQDQAIKPTWLASAYIEKAFREMLARDVGCTAMELPQLPGELFYFLPRRSHMRDYDARLNMLVSVMGKNLAAMGKHPEDAWALASIAVAGQQPLASALVYGLMNPPASAEAWNGESLMRVSAPVSLLGREALNDSTIGNLKISRGQHLHICPFLVHLHADRQPGSNAPGKSIAFGDGPHTCAGRRISLKITEAFLNHWARAGKRLQMDVNGIRLVRDFVLLPLEKK